MTSYSAENSKSPRLAVIDELGDKRIISNDSNHKFFITSPPPLKTPSSTATSFYQSENNRCSPPNVRPPEIVTVVLDYKAKFSDELNLKRGSVVEVLSKDAKVSGDEGWWTGKLKPEEDDQALSTEKVGIFPSNFVRSDLNATLIELENRQDLKATNNCLQNVIFDDLKFENLLGIGGFGRVHKAKWKNQDVAVKTAHIEPGSSLDEIRDCVEREARLFGLLSHKNIVQLLGVSLQAPNFCLILEYCAGESLNKILKHNTQKLSANILIDWAMQIARGMHYLHEQAPISLVHRDLKSSNVLVKEDVNCSAFKFRQATLKITDFGLAREAQYASRMSMCGTYAWMSPEVIKNSTYSKASDVWSYGVLLWELLTGEVPYKNIDAMAIAYGVGVNQLTLPVPSTCPEPFTKLMHDCWSIEPHKRPTFGALLSSMDELSKTTDPVEDESFHSMQQNWREEIQQLFSEIKNLEVELRDKEEQLKTTAAKQEMKEEIIRQKEDKLKHREIELVHRELQLVLKKPAEPPLRRGKPRLFGGVLPTKHPTGEQISLPTGFRNLISVTNEPYNASESPPTSPQGSRGELRVHVFGKDDDNASKTRTPDSPPLAPSLSTALEQPAFLAPKFPPPSAPGALNYPTGSLGRPCKSSVGGGNGLLARYYPQNQGRYVISGVGTTSAGDVKNGRYCRVPSPCRRPNNLRFTATKRDQKIDDDTTSPAGAAAPPGRHRSTPNLHQIGVINGASSLISAVLGHKFSPNNECKQSETDTDDEFLSAVAGAGPLTTGAGPQTPKKCSSRKSSSTNVGGGAGSSHHSSSTFFGAKLAEAFRSLTTVLTAVPVGGRNVCDEIVCTPCGTTAVLVPPSPYVAPRRQSQESCGGLDYFYRQHSRSVSNPASATASPAKQRSMTPRVDLSNNNNNSTMPALYTINHSPVPCPSTSSGGSGSAASSTKSRSRKPVPSDKYRSYTKTQRPRSCDESQPTDAVSAAENAAGARGVSNPNYQRHFFPPKLKTSLTPAPSPTPPQPPQRPYTLDIVGGGSPRRSFATTPPTHPPRIPARVCSGDSSGCSSAGAGPQMDGGMAVATKNNNFSSASNQSNLSAAQKTPAESSGISTCGSSAPILSSRDSLGTVVERRAT